MSVVNLSKNQVINLSKIGGHGLKKVTVGLGWDPVKNTNSGGILSKLLKMSPLAGVDIDCDAFCVALDSMDKEVETVYFGNKSGCKGCIFHTGDNLTGDGEGDDEQIIINLSNMDKRVQKIAIAVNIYRGKEKGQHFGSIEKAFMRIVDDNKNSEMCMYKLSGQEYSGYTTVTFGELYRNASGDWQFEAIGEADRANTIGEYIRKYR